MNAEKVKSLAAKNATTEYVKDGTAETLLHKSTVLNHTMNAEELKSLAAKNATPDDVKDRAAETLLQKSPVLVGKSEENFETKVKCLKIFKTILLMLTWICMGMRVFVEFSSIPILRTRLSTDVEGLSYAMSIGAMGGLLAAPLAACADRFGGHSDILVSLLLIIAAVSNAAKPYCTGLGLFTVCDFVSELVWTVIAPIGDSMTTSMWGSKAGPPLHAVHAGFTIGALIGPLLASVFINDQSQAVSDETTPINSSHVTESHNVTHFDSTDNQKQQDTSNIENAFLITSILMVLTACVFFVMEFVKISNKGEQLKKKSYSWKDIFSPSNWAGGNARMGILVFGAMNLFYICHLGTLYGPTVLLTTYAVDSRLNFTGSEAAALTSASGLGGVIARGFLIFASGFIGVNTILIVAIHGQLIAALCLLIFGTQSKEMLWIFTCIFGAVCRPIWAAGYQWANDYIILVAFHFATSRLFSRIVGIGQTALQGYLYTNVSKESVFYTSVVYAILNCFVLYAMLCIGRKYNTRHIKDRIDQDEKNNRA